jgi:hypothetical protein
MILEDVLSPEEVAELNRLVDGQNLPEPPLESGKENTAASAASLVVIKLTICVRRKFERRTSTRIVLSCQK